MDRALTEEFVRTRFGEYYREHRDEVKIPSRLERREFGFLLFKERAMVRHRSFTTSSDLLRTMAELVPAHVYYSSAYYERPEAEMEKKEWQGADLIFDIDADHIPNQCRTDHKLWVCDVCGQVGTGSKPRECSRCGGDKIQEENQICEACLGSAKRETIKLVDFLIDDFGYEQSEIELYFSGNRGYHVHVESDDVSRLDQSARREIVDYVSGTGISLRCHGFSRAIPGLKDRGWRGRLGRRLYDILNSKERGILEGDEGIALKRVLKHRDELLRMYDGNLAIRPPRGVDKAWEALGRVLTASETANVDSVVTTDIHRLIRLAGTLHGKTGLKATQVQMVDIDRFDPLRESLAFSTGRIKVKAACVGRFRLGDTEYGPYSDEVVEIPTAAAMLLICKRTAVLV